jgi:imidazolonepropionase-like amidohydrolase
MSRSIRTCVLAGLTVLLAGTVQAQSGREIFDRGPYYQGKPTTTDDVQRVPVPAGYNEPKGSFVLVGGRVLDGTGAEPRAATVVVEGKTIAAILSPGASNWPKDAQVYDVTGETIMPGLIDLHTHLTYVEEFGRPAALSGENVADATLRGINRMHIYAQSGITSVRDVASDGEVPFALKRWQSEGRVAGPRVFPAGQLIVGRGGHGTEGFALRTAPDYAQAAVREASGPDAWRDAVRIQFKQGADIIKLASHYSQAEIDAAVEEAHALGIPVTVDAETQYIDRAIKAGVDCIEHPLPRSDRAIELMAKNGIASVPTLVPYRYINRLGGGYFGSTSRRFTLTEDSIFEMLRKMKKSGVKMGIGTDLIVDWVKYLPFAYIDELKSFVAVGYTNSEALLAATRTNAQILRMGDRLGTLEVGKLADIIVIDGKPDQNLDDLARVARVFVNGRLTVDDGRIYSEPHEPEPAPQKNAQP